MKKNKYFKSGNKNIWLYWPGKSAMCFPTDIKDGIMTCSPDDHDVGDMELLSVEPMALEEAIIKEYGYLNHHTKNLLLDFSLNSKYGDIVIARAQFDAIVGVGVISGDYRYDADRTPFRHTRKVNWILTDIYPYPEELKIPGKWHRFNLLMDKQRDVMVQWLAEHGIVI